MKRIPVVLLAFTLLGAGVARAAPPTVVPSPGYDARLQEQRAALSRAQVTPAAKRVTPRHRAGRR